MLFNKDDKITNEITIYQTKPNMLLGCKKAIFGVILLIVVSIITMISHIDWMTFPISHFIEIILMLLVAIYLILCIKHHENSGIILSLICFILLCVLLYENGPYMILHIEPFNIPLTFPL